MNLRKFLSIWLSTSALTYFLYDIVWIVTNYQEYSHTLSTYSTILGLDLSYCLLISLYNVVVAFLFTTKIPFRKTWIPQATLLGGVLLLSNTALTLFIEHLMNQWLNPIPTEYSWSNAYLMGLIASMLTLGITVDYFHKQAKRQQEYNLQLQQQLMRAQLNPHFIFNNLSILTSLITTNPQQAESFVIHLSRIYRYILRNINNDLVTIREALDFVDDYLKLLHLRFEQIEVQIDNFEYDNHDFILSQSLQILIENAVKHNALTTNKPLLIQIKRDHNFLIVSNNILPTTYKSSNSISSNHIGLQTLAQIYQTKHNQSIKINKTATQFTVFIPIIQQ